MQTMKILAVCGMGVGSSLILKMQVEKVTKKLGLQAKVEIADITTARALASGADLIITSKELAERLGDVKAPIITIKNFMDLNEMTEKVTTALNL
jgi:PTS system ascorbate-specific IIB component